MIRLGSIASVVVLALLSSSTMAMELPWRAPAVEFQIKLNEAIHGTLNRQTAYTRQACEHAVKYSCLPYRPIVFSQSDAPFDDSNPPQSIIPIYAEEDLNICLWEKYNSPLVSLSPPCHEQMTKLKNMTSDYASYLHFVSWLILETTCLHLVMASILIYIGFKMSTCNNEQTTRVKRNMMLFTWSIFLLYSSVMIPYAMFVCLAAVFYMWYVCFLPTWYCCVYIGAMNGLGRLMGHPGVLMIVDASSLFVLGLMSLLYSWRLVEHCEECDVLEEDGIKYYLVMEEEESESSCKADEEVYEGVPLSMQTQIV